MNRKTEKLIDLMNRKTGTLTEQSRTKKILAVSSKTQDDNHILIWDFDGIPLKDVLNSLSKTQDFNGLGYIYIFKSKNGFNAVCLDKFFVKEAYNIKFYTRWSDFWHTKIGYKQGNWAWKISDDKEFVRILAPTDSWDHRVGSLAHKLYIEKQFGLKIGMGLFDGFKKVDIESYNQNVI